MIIKEGKELRVKRDTREQEQAKQKVSRVRPRVHDLL